jgi:hypothetical protein
MILGFPLRSVLRTVGKRGVILLATSLPVFQAPALLEHLQRNPPRSVWELAVWCGVAFTLFLILLRMVFGPGAISRFFERVLTAAVYDTLKGLGRFLLRSRWARRRHGSQQPVCLISRQTPARRHRRQCAYPVAPGGRAWGIMRQALPGRTAERIPLPMSRLGYSSGVPPGVAAGSNGLRFCHAVALRTAG